MTLVKKSIIQNPKFKISDIVRRSKYKNIFAKRYTPNWSEEVFLIKKVKNTVLWSDLKGEEIVGTLKTNCNKQIKKTLELKK